MYVSEKFVKPNPRLKTNFLSRLFFWWLKPLFFFKDEDKNLEIQDLYNVLPKLSSKTVGDKLEGAWFDELKNSRANNSKPSLLKASFIIFGWPFFYYGIHVFVLCVILRGLQPYILGLLISHFDPNANSSSGYILIYASTLIIMTILQAMIGHHSVVGRKEVGMKISIAYSSLIYRKLLRLSIVTSNKYNTGMIVNLLSNDLSKFEDVCMFLHYIWVLPIQGLVMAYFIWNNVGVASLAGIVVLAIQTIPIQGYLGKVTSRVRAKVASKTDERVRLMSEIVNGIRVIKMYTWEKSFENLVFLARKCEVDAIAIKSYLRAVSTATSAFTESTSLFVIVSTYVLLGNFMEASVVYSVAQYFGMIKIMMTVFYPRAISSAAEARVSIRRIQEFLLLDEVKNNSVPEKSDISYQVTVKNLNICWKENMNENVLREINLDFVAGKLYVIAGPVGSGKSTLLKAILGELQASQGEVHVNGEISYASPEPWLFPGTVRSNILFGQDFDQVRYDRVIDACALRDLNELPNGDTTLVGDAGCTLSGGQCARVNLARAIYRNADVYLIDDPLAALDSHVGRCIFDKCINGFLKGKTRILVTHNIKYFKETDEIIIIKSGKVDFKGSFTNLEAQDYRLSELHLPIVNEVLSEGQNTPQNKPELVFIKDTAKKIETESIKELATKSQGATDFVCWRYFRAGGSTVALLCLALSFILAQVSVSGCDYWLAHWIKQEESKLKLSSNEDISLDLRIAVYVFSALLLSSIIMWMTSSLCFYKICTNASKNLHNQMFSSLLKTPVCFFELNHPGVILNRFSKDIGLVDEILPTVTLDALQVLLMMSGIAIQVLVINWWSIFPMIVMGITCWKLKNIYLPTAQNIKRLESKTKSPIYTHVASTISGLTTIRSAKVQSKVKNEFDNLQDVHTSANYLNIVSSSAFGYWLDIISVSLLAFVIFSFTLVNRNEISAAIVGLAITQIFMLYGKVQYGLRQTAEMMTQLISVERIFQFINLEQEGIFETRHENNLPMGWPNEGRIKIDNLTLKYANFKDPVLKNITLDIKPQEKIGIVGRTGAGKTSLISALYRLVDPEGSIYIDGINIKTIGLHDLRGKITIIPQNPVLFTTSVRNNLDPLHKCNDEVLIQVLKEVSLKSQLASLDYVIANEGNNLSSGEKQLLCLARAIIANNRIVVLDEATSNIDFHTEEIIQNIINKRFLNCTVITIAHRLSTISNSDRILVIDQGRVVEFDSPEILMKHKDGYFYKIIRNT